MRMGRTICGFMAEGIVPLKYVLKPPVFPTDIVNAISAGVLQCRQRLTFAGRGNKCAHDSHGPIILPLRVKREIVSVRVYLPFRLICSIFNLHRSYSKFKPAEKGNFFRFLVFSLPA